MDRQEDDREDALTESQDTLDRTDFMQRDLVSVVFWGIVLVGCVIAIAMFTNHVLGWGG